MNARQKAKHYKRMYEELLNKPLKLIVITQKIDTLEISRLYPQPIITRSDEDITTKILTRDLVNALVDQMDKYVTIKTEFLPLMNQYKFNAVVEVVRRDK